MLSPGLRAVNILDADVSAVNSVTLVTTGLAFANYGKNSIGSLKKFHFRAWLKLQQLGAGGFRFRFSGANSPMQGYRIGFDPAIPGVVLQDWNTVVSSITYAPTDGQINILVLEGTVNFAPTSTGLDLQFAQGAADPAASTILAGSYMEIVTV